MSISFYHRIVQWAIYRVINPILVKGYIEDSYGCIPGRGSLSAMKRLKYWVEAVEKKPGTWYYLKLDISKYFYRISHEVLKKILAKKIKDRRLLDVLYSIIDCKHTPFGLPPGKGPGEVPLEERLFDVGCRWETCFRRYLRISILMRSTSFVKGFSGFTIISGIWMM